MREKLTVTNYHCFFTHCCRWIAASVVCLSLNNGWGQQAPQQQSPQKQPSAPVAMPGKAVDNVVLVTMDGLRWQELFGGADETLINKDKDSGGVKDVPATTQRFMRETAEQRRQVLMPFFWTKLANDGVILGDPATAATAVVTNQLNFSYPGYSEILCGFVDPAIDSNAKRNNQNETVLEWISKKPGFADRIAAFCSWDVFPYIINEQRSGIPVNAGWEPVGDILDASSTSAATPLDSSLPTAIRQLQQLDQLSREIPRYWPEVRYDYVTYKAAELYLMHRQPRVLYLSLGETDDWAHAARYDLYLDAAQRNDAYIGQLWSLLQSLPQYQNNTVMIITTDHGRGDNRIDWQSHGRDIADCQYIWIAAIGPNIAAAPANAGMPGPITQSQVAATAAAALGLDYCVDQPMAARPLKIFKQ